MSETRNIKLSPIGHTRSDANISAIRDVIKDQPAGSAADALLQADDAQSNRISGKRPNPNTDKAQPPPTSNQNNTSHDLKYTRPTDELRVDTALKHSSFMNMTGGSMGTTYTKKQLKLMKKHDMDFKKAHQLKAMHLLQDLKMQQALYHG